MQIPKNPCNGQFQDQHLIQGVDGGGGLRGVLSSEQGKVCRRAIGEGGQLVGALGGMSFEQARKGFGGL